MIKQRKESVTIYSKAGRLDLKKGKREKLKLSIPSYLIRSTSSKLEELILKSIEEIGCSSIKDLGKLISFLKAEYPGQMDMKEVADLAKKNLK